MKPTPLNYPNKFQTVREFGQSNLQKFALVLQQKSEQLSKTSKYLILSLFLISSLGTSFSLLHSGESTIAPSLPTRIPVYRIPYFSDLKSESTATDSMFLSNATPQAKNSHD